MSEGVDVFEFDIGEKVRVNLTGRIIGRSEFAKGDPCYLIEHKRKGKIVQEWVVADKLEPIE